MSHSPGRIHLKTGHPATRRLLCRGWLPLRLGLGWLCITVGILGLILPIIPGIPVLAAGVALVGRRDPVLRRAIINLKLLLRRSAQQRGLWRLTGRYGLRLVDGISRPAPVHRTKRARSS